MVIGDRGIRMISVSPITHYPYPSIRSLFEPAPGITYLDAATYGLPPTPSVNVLTRALRRCQTGEADWVVVWDRKAGDSP
jgi:hypothetical protein